MPEAFSFVSELIMDITVTAVPNTALNETAVMQGIEEAGEHTSERRRAAWQAWKHKKTANND